MAKKPTTEPLYVIDSNQMLRLRIIEKNLFGRGEHLTPDKRRDIANSFNVILAEISNQQLSIGKPKGEEDGTNKR